jgi:hypothetical protein
MSSRDERLTQHQETFRSANQWMHEAINAPGPTRVPFLCECADFECLGRLEASLDEFEVVHTSEDRYFILPNHPRIDGEVVLGENARYQVVSKGKV